MPPDNLRNRLIAALMEEEAYPRENNPLSQSTPEENLASFQATSSNYGGSNLVQNEIQTSSNQPIILNRTTHPLGVVPRPASNNYNHNNSQVEQLSEPNSDSFVA